MKKRVLSAIALAMALSMTFGMTVFASGNSSVKTEEIKSDAMTFDPIASGNATVSEGEKASLEAEANTVLAVIVGKPDNATLGSLTAEELKDAKTVATMVAEYKGISNADISVLAAADIDISGFSGGSFTITLNKAIDPNANLMVLHLNGNVWEPLRVEVGTDGKTITVYADSLSPIVFAEVKAGQTSNGGNQTSAATPAEPASAAAPAESPKTGAVASTAGIMAAICLAGAAVSVKKARKED